MDLQDLPQDIHRWTISDKMKFVFRQLSEDPSLQKIETIWRTLFHLEDKNGGYGEGDIAAPNYNMRGQEKPRGRKL